MTQSMIDFYIDPSLVVSSKNGEYGVDDFYYLQVRGLTKDHLKYMTM